MVEGVEEVVLMVTHRGDLGFGDVGVALGEVLEAFEFGGELLFGFLDGGVAEAFGFLRGVIFGLLEHGGEDFAAEGVLGDEFPRRAGDEGDFIEDGFFAEVFAAVVDDDADGDRGEVAIGLQADRGEAFEDEVAVEHDPFRLCGLPDAEGGVAELAVEEDIDAVTDHGVVGGEVAEVFAAEGGGAVEGDGEAVFGDVDEGVAHHGASLHDVAAQGTVADGESELVEETEAEFVEFGIFVGCLNRLDEF